MLEQQCIGHLGVAHRHALQRLSGPDFLLRTG
jgi:hypothetical protein